MNGIKCPKCDLVNMLSATECHRCQTSLVNLPPTAEVSVPIEQTFEAQTIQRQQPAFAFQNPANMPNGIPQDNEIGRKTFFWYRVYLVLMTAIYVGVTGLGAIAAYMSQYETNAAEASEMFMNGIIFFIVGIPFALAFAIAFFLPRRSWNWIVGIVFIAISLTSCCFLPISVPLLVFWLKPETKAYLGKI